jgi:fibrillarin-like rRNA methylase
MQKYFSAVVVREEVPGKKVFHKYRTVKATDQGTEIFQRNMKKLDAERGRVIHINYYQKDSAAFVRQWKSAFP